MSKIVIRLGRDTYRRAQGAPRGEAAQIHPAPFDTPSHVVIEMASREQPMTLTFAYALGADEDARTEELPEGIIAKFGSISGRVMQLCVPIEKYQARIEGMRQRLDTQQRKLTSEAKKGSPLRVAAHYELITSTLLPLLAEQLPRLREVTYG